MAHQEIVNADQRGGSYDWRRSATRRRTTLLTFLTRIERTNPSARNFVVATQRREGHHPHRYEVHAAGWWTPSRGRSVSSPSARRPPPTAAAGFKPLMARSARSRRIETRWKTTQQRCEKFAQYLGEPDLPWEQLFSTFGSFGDREPTTILSFLFTRRTHGREHFLYISTARGVMIRWLRIRQPRAGSIRLQEDRDARKWSANDGHKMEATT